MKWIMLNIKLPTISDSLFTTTLPVRIYDVNYGNHLGHDSLISLLHEARVRFLKSKNCTEFNVSGAGIIITSLAVNYIDEAFYGDELRINLSVGEMSRTSMELYYSVIHPEASNEIARAFTLVTFFDYEKRKVMRVPEVFAQLADKR